METILHGIEYRRSGEGASASTNTRWDSDRNVIRNRRIDFGKKLLPDGLSFADRFEFLDPDRRRLQSRVQARTYANMFGVLESVIGAKTRELSKQYVPLNRTARLALVRLADGEINHRQELFCRIERLVADGMAPGYTFVPQFEHVTSFVLQKSSWAVLALICQIELSTQVHYQQSIEPDAQLSDVYKDVFFLQWKEKSRHAVMHEIQWLREDTKLDGASRDHAVNDLIELIQGIDAMLVFQAPADVDYFLGVCNCDYSPGQIERLHAGILNAYRWQYIASGMQAAHFDGLLAGLLNADQAKRVRTELAPITAAAGQRVGTESRRASALESRRTAR